MHKGGTADSFAPGPRDSGTTGNRRTLRRGSWTAPSRTRCCSQTASTMAANGSVGLNKTSKFAVFDVKGGEYSKAISSADHNSTKHSSVLVHEQRTTSA